MIAARRTLNGSKMELRREKKRKEEKQQKTTRARHTPGLVQVKPNYSGMLRGSGETITPLLSA